jgi:hypothetical protein
LDVDETPPTITFSGNQGTYTVDQTVNITCSASDVLSGVATSSCPTISGSASSFGLGASSFGASVVSRAVDGLSFGEGRYEAGRGQRRGRPVVSQGSAW